MKRILLITLVTVFALSVLGLEVATLPAVAQGAGTTVVSAALSIYITGVTSSPPETVNVRRITAPWSEDTVTWTNFGTSFVAITPTASFVADAIGWHSADVTALVQAWHDGTYPNYGLALDQGDTPFTTYNSSEYATVDLRPRLDVTYTTGGGSPITTSYFIQRPTGVVQDAYVWTADYPDTNFNYETLYTGHYGNGMKYALLQFTQLPTAVALESLSARAAPAPGITLWSLGLLGMLGLVALRVKRRR